MTFACEVAHWVYLLAVVGAPHEAIARHANAALFELQRVDFEGEPSARDMDVVLLAFEHEYWKRLDEQQAGKKAG